jgi:predicted house-cleaning noncanonical NTP pyrophosphatase (MazG superfamily)
MVTFIFKKLVRDKTVERHIKFGITPTHRILSSTELKAALRDKLSEEALEVAQATDHEEMVKELADLYEVIKALCHTHGITEKEIKAAQKATEQERGSFEKGIYIEGVTMPDDNPWVTYFRAAPDKYREIK